MVKLYTELMGTTESNARCVYMYLSSDGEMKEEENEATSRAQRDLGLKIEEHS